MKHSEGTGIEEAIRIAGGQSAMADAEGVTQQAVSGWRKQGYAPRKRAEGIAERTGVPVDRLVDPRIAKLFR